MNKTTKGALAATTAAVLLLGGAGTLAYWTDSDTVNGGSVNSGFLTLDAVPGCATTPWKYADGKAGAPATVVNFVPGDIITKTCSFTIGAEGDNLAATPTIPSSVAITSSAGGSFSATVAATYTLDGAAYTGATPITEDNNTDVLAVKFLVTIPYGTDETGTPIVNGNDTQQIDASLATLTVALKQNDPNPS